MMQAKVAGAKRGTEDRFKTTLKGVFLHPKKPIFPTNVTELKCENCHNFMFPSTLGVRNPGRVRRVCRDCLTSSLFSLEVE
jgi:hypothetical protein